MLNQIRSIWISKGIHNLPSCYWFTINQSNSKERLFWIWWKLDGFGSRRRKWSLLCLQVWICWRKLWKESPEAIFLHFGISRTQEMVWKIASSWYVWTDGCHWKVNGSDNGSCDQGKISDLQLAIVIPSRIDSFCAMTQKYAISAMTIKFDNSFCAMRFFLWKAWKFFLRNDSVLLSQKIYILFTQWKFFLRNGSFTVPESKNSFCAMTKLQILTTFILRNESRSYAYDVSILCLSCITSYYVPTKVHIKKLLLILYVCMYIVQILFAQWALKYLKIRLDYFKK